MQTFISLALALIATVSATNTTNPVACKPFPATSNAFSAQFEQPKPPLVKAEFKTSFIQHKWDQNLSHPTTGYIYNSPSQKLVTVYQAYEEGFGLSKFDYSNTTSDGLVDNTLTSYSGSSDTPEVWRGYVNANFLLFSENFLIDNEAVFGGLATRDMIPGQVATWNILYQGAVAITLYVDTCSTIVGWDYFSPGRRTRVITKFFNIYAGPVHI